MPKDKIDDAGEWVFLKGDRVFVVDSEDNLEPLLLRVISQREFDRLHFLEDSFKKEKV